MTEIDRSELPHVDDLTEYNSDADWAVDDDGELYMVRISDFNAKTTLVPERYVLTDEKRKQRDGVGQPCRTCGEEIGFRAIILKDQLDNYHHLGCYADQNTDREGCEE